MGTASHASACFLCCFVYDLLCILYTSVGSYYNTDIQDIWLHLVGSAMLSLSFMLTSVSASMKSAWSASVQVQLVSRLGQKYCHTEWSSFPQRRLASSLWLAFLKLIQDKRLSLHGSAWFGRHTEMQTSTIIIIIIILLYTSQCGHKA